MARPNDYRRTPRVCTSAQNSVAANTPNAATIAAITMIFVDIGLLLGLRSRVREKPIATFDPDQLCPRIPAIASAATQRCGMIWDASMR